MNPDQVTVASARHAGGPTDQVVADLIDDATQRRPLGVLGDDGVNVVELNLAVEQAEAANGGGS